MTAPGQRRVDSLVVSSYDTAVSWVGGCGRCPALTQECRAAYSVLQSHRAVSASRPAFEEYVRLRSVTAEPGVQSRAEPRYAGAGCIPASLPLD